MSSTDEPYITPLVIDSDGKVISDPLPSLEITESNIFTGYHTRGATAEELGLMLDENGHWVSI